MRSLGSICAIFLLLTSVSILGQVTIDFTHSDGSIPSDHYAPQGITDVTNGYWFSNRLEPDNPADPIIITFLGNQTTVTLTCIIANETPSVFTAWTGDNATGTQIDSESFTSAGQTISLTNGSAVIKSVKIDPAGRTGGAGIFNDYDDLQYDSSLPVELTSFTAATSNSFVTLHWETATEVNNYGFEIERQYQAPSSEYKDENWEKIGFVQGHGTTNSPKLYSFVDDNLPDASEVSYRLKQIDNDGTSIYSKVVTVDISSITDVDDNSINYKFALEQNYPNPFNPSTKIKFTVPNGERKSLSSGIQTKLTVYNSLGAKVAVLVNEAKQPGEYEVDFNAENLSSGLYLYEITIGNKYKAGKKMLLLR